jgi:hypothetical protein
MKTFTLEERVRLNFLYDLLDFNYRGLREAAQIQRAAVLHGSLTATVIGDIELVALSRATATAWVEIQSIWAPATEPAPEPPPDADPPAKETVQ